jgi:hypothetical protein
MDEQAAALAARLVKEGGRDPQANIARMFRLTLGRQPTNEEIIIARGYLERVGAPHSGVSPPSDETAYRRALTMLSKVVLNLNEMVYVD